MHRPVDWILLLYMTVQGIMQHWQSSPHQQGSLTGGFAIGLLAIEEEDEVVEVAEVVVVEGGMIVCVPMRSDGSGGS